MRKQRGNTPKNRGTRSTQPRGVSAVQHNNSKLEGYIALCTTPCLRMLELAVTFVVSATSNFNKATNLFSSLCLAHVEAVLEMQNTKNLAHLQPVCLRELPLLSPTAGGQRQCANQHCAGN